MKILRGEDRDRWMARNQRENARHVLKAGDRIKDLWLRSGVVQRVQIPRGASIENHGSITVLLDDGTTETYAGFGWQIKFRVTKRDHQ